MTGFLLQFVFLLAICGYMGSIYHLSVIFLCSKEKTRRLAYWIIPILVSCLLLGLMELAGRASGIASETTTPSVLAVLFVGPLALHALMAGFVFRCQACGLTRNTYRVWWRKGSYWCPHCDVRYHNGKPDPRR